ncbi:unnamed protein product, partial [Gordionus sp. m RMFG-2023]
MNPYLTKTFLFFIYIKLIINLGVYSDSSHPDSILHKICPFRGSLLLFCHDELIYSEEDDDVIKEDDDLQTSVNYKNRYQDYTLPHSKAMINDRNEPIKSLFMGNVTNNTNPNNISNSNTNHTKYIWIKIAALEPTFRYHIVARSNRLFLFDCACDTEEGLFACYSIPGKGAGEEIY